MAKSVEIEIGLRITATIMRSLTWLGIGQVCSEVYGYGCISPVWYFLYGNFILGLRYFDVQSLSFCTTLYYKEITFFPQ